MNMNMNPLKELINILESDLDRIDNMDINYAEKYGRLKQAIKGRILRYSQILNNLQNKSYGTLQDIYGTNGVKNMFECKIKDCFDYIKARGLSKDFAKWLTTRK